MSGDASRDGSGSEGDGGGRTDVDALLPEALPPALADHPVGGGAGGDHQEGGDEAAREGDDLKCSEEQEVSREDRLEDKISCQTVRWCAYPPLFGEFIQ